MDVTTVAHELRRLNGDHPIFNPARPPDAQATDWIVWSAGETLIRKWEEQAHKRTQEAKAKKAAGSTSTGEPASRDYLGRPGSD